MKMNKVLTSIIGVVCLNLSAQAISGEFGLDEGRQWQPFTKVIINPETGNSVPLTLVFADNGKAVYKPLGVSVDPDNKICENSPESCFAANPTVTVNK